MKSNFTLKGELGIDLAMINDDVEKLSGIVKATLSLYLNKSGPVRQKSQK